MLLLVLVVEDFNVASNGVDFNLNPEPLAIS